MRAVRGQEDNKVTEPGHAQHTLGDRGGTTGHRAGSAIYDRGGQEENCTPKQRKNKKHCTEYYYKKSIKDERELLQVRNPIMTLPDMQSLLNGAKHSLGLHTCHPYPQCKIYVPFRLHWFHSRCCISNLPNLQHFCRIPIPDGRVAAPVQSCSQRTPTAQGSGSEGVFGLGRGTHVSLTI